MKIVDIVMNYASGKATWKIRNGEEIRAEEERERENRVHIKNGMRTKNGCIRRALWSRSKSRNKSKLLFIFAFEMLLTDEK